MSEAVVANRYADALFQLADENNNAETLITELAVVKDAFQANKKLIQILNHPKISESDKMNMIDEVFGECRKDIIHTIKLLVTRHRIENIIEIINQVTEIYNEANGIAVANVYSVRELTETERENIANSLKQQLKKKEVKLNNKIDPSVLGGLKIRVGNTIYDGTISGKLNQMRHNIGTSAI